MTVAEVLEQAHDKAQARRYRAAAAAPSAFGPLLPTDCLVTRIERIWNLKPSAIVVKLWWPHPLDESFAETRTLRMTRADAALVLRAARAEGRLIERSMHGYDVETLSGLAL